MPLRTLVVAMIMAGFGLWQAWSCTDGMMMSPLTAASMATTMIHNSSADHTAVPVRAAEDQEPTPGMPAGMAGICITVLASFAAALIMMSSPLRLLGLVRRLGELLLRPVEVALRAPAPDQLCVSRT